MNLEGPYKNSADTLQYQLKILSKAQLDEEELMIFLYQEVLPHIQHQYVIYSTIIYVMDFFNTYLTDKAYDIGLIVLDFLSYVFRVHIREDNMILTPACNYDTIHTSVKYSSEAKYYKYFKRFYSTNFTTKGCFAVSDYRSIYYASILENPSKIQEQLISLLSDDNAEIVFNAKIALMLTHFKGIQDQPFDKTICMDIQQSCLQKELNTLFGFGYHEVVFWCAKLYLDITNCIEIQKEDINQIIKLYIEGCNPIDNNEVEDLEDVDSFPNILMENISSVLFRNFFGIGKVINKIRLNVIQTYFLNILYKNKIHTNTLLYCGILPHGMSQKQILYYPNIYTCYSFNQNSI